MIGVAERVRNNFYSSREFISENSPTDQILQSITARREEFLRNIQGQKAVAYNLEFNRQIYLELNKFKGKYPKEYEDVKTGLDLSITDELETLIGERLNLILSIKNHGIKDREIYDTKIGEPLMRMFIRGRDYRKLYGNPIDHERENAEVVGFDKIQKTLCDKNTPIGTMMLSVSPPGGSYPHNFYDIFTLREKDGKRYIEARRYSSALSDQEYLNNIKILTDKGFIPRWPLDVYFLLNPIIIKGKTPDDIHKFLHKKHNILSTEEFEIVLDGCEPLIKEYLRFLSSNPEDKDNLARKFDHILIGADYIEDELNKRKGKPITVFSTDKNYMMANAIRGRRRVRNKTTGCGASGGLSLTNLETAIERVMKSSFSVADFGSKAENDSNLCHCGNRSPHFHCPGKKSNGEACNHAIIVGRGTTKCPSCGAGKTC